MRIGIHSTTLNPLEGNYPILEAIASWSELADEIVIVDGGSTDGFLERVKQFPKVKIIHLPWSKPFCQEEFPAHLNAGFYALTTEWRIKCDADVLFHERDIIEIKHGLRSAHNKGLLVAGFEKRIPLNRFRYHVKTTVPFAINATKGTNICYGAATDRKTDWCYPIIKQTEESGIPYGIGIRLAKTIGIMWNFEYYFRDKQQASQRLQAASYGFHGLWGETAEQVWEIFMDQVKTRLENSFPLLSGQLPKWIRERAMNVSENCLGFNSWGLYKEQV